MNVTIITNDYDIITSSTYTDYDNKTLSNCTNNGNTFDIIIPTLLLTKPCGLSFLCLLSLMVYTLIKPLIDECWKKLLYPQHPVRCTITGPSDCGKSVFLTILF